MRNKLSKKILKKLSQEIKLAAPGQTGGGQNPDLAGGNVQGGNRGGKGSQSDVLKNFTAEMVIKNKRLLGLAVKGVVAEVNTEEMDENSQTMSENLVGSELSGDRINKAYLDEIKETHSVSIFGSKYSDYDLPISKVINNEFFLNFKNFHLGDENIYREREDENGETIVEEADPIPTKITAGWTEMNEELVFCVFHAKKENVFKEVIVENYTDQTLTTPADGSAFLSRRYATNAKTDAEYDKPIAFGKVFYDTTFTEYVNLVFFNEVLEPLGFSSTELDTSQQAMAAYPGASITMMENGGIDAFIESKVQALAASRHSIPTPGNDPEYDGPYRATGLPSVKTRPGKEYPADDPARLDFLRNLSPSALTPKLRPDGTPQVGGGLDVEKIKKMLPTVTTFPEWIKGDPQGKERAKNLSFNAGVAGRAVAIYHFDYRYQTGRDGKIEVEKTTGEAERGTNIFRINLIFEFSDWNSGYAPGSSAAKIPTSNFLKIPSPSRIRVEFENIPTAGAADLYKNIKDVFGAKGFGAKFPKGKQEKKISFGDGIFVPAEGESIDERNERVEGELNDTIDREIKTLKMMLIVPPDGRPPKLQKGKNGDYKLALPMYITLLKAYLKKVQERVPPSLPELNKLIKSDLSGGIPADSINLLQIINE